MLGHKHAIVLSKGWRSSSARFRRNRRAKGLTLVAEARLEVMATTD